MGAPSFERFLLEGWESSIQPGCPRSRPPRRKTWETTTLNHPCFSQPFPLPGESPTPSVSRTSASASSQSGRTTPKLSSTRRHNSRELAGRLAGRGNSLLLIAISFGAATSSPLAQKRLRKSKPRSLSRAGQIVDSAAPLQSAPRRRKHLRQNPGRRLGNAFAGSRSPIWSSTMRSSVLSFARRNMVSRKLFPRAP